MWFGTQHGLYRYDGFRFVLTEPNTPEYPSQVPVYSLLEVEGEEGDTDIWIGNQRGLGRWNRTTGEYTQIESTGRGSDSVAEGSSEVRAILKAKDGDLWIGRMNGLARLSNDEIVEYNHDPADPHSISDDEIRGLAEDDRGNLWIATGGGGLNKLGTDRDGPFERFQNDPEDPNSLSDDYTRVVYLDETDRVWVGTFRGGLNQLNEEHTGFERFMPDADRPETSLSSSRVRSILEDTEGDLWIGTDHGLNLYDPTHKSFSHYKEAVAKPNSISDDRINSIYQDRAGVIWLGTQRRLSKFDRRNLGAFERMWRDPEASTTLSANTIQAFAEESDGTLWIGTYDGLNRYEPETGVYTEFRPEAGNPNSLGNDKVGSLLIDREGILWIGTYEDGLNRFDPKTGIFEKIPTAKPKVPCIFQDHLGIIWIATFDGGLMTIDPKTGARETYTHDPNNANSLSTDSVISIFEDSQEILWFGTHSGGLNRFDRKTKTFTRYLSDEDRPDSLSSNGIFSISEFKDDLLIGTFGGGLNIWSKNDRDAGRAVFTRGDLEPRSIYGLLIEKDANGRESRVWASTDRGLWRRHPDTDTWRQQHGAQDFNFGAYMVSQTGDLLFGNDSGVLRVSPDKIRPSHFNPPIVLTDFLIKNESQSFDQPLHLINSFNVDYRDAIISFEFAALDYADPDKTTYEYSIGEGVDDWVIIGNGHRATFTNLAPRRDYRLSVRAKDSDGVVSDDVVLAEINVAPHPLRSNVAFAIYGLILVGAVWWFLRQQSNKREQLERLVSERTAALAERNTALEELNQKFEEASYTDSLTGLRNRRYLLGTIEQDLDLVLRYYTDREHSVDGTKSEVRPDFLFLLIDLDGFKEVNDTYGHTAGDRVLEQVCNLMERACRKSDTLIRWGGDEFLIVGRYTERTAAEDLAGRIREAICEHPFDIGTGRPIRLTSSIGFSCYPFVPSKPNLLNWEQIIGIADQALYLVKEAGRNSWAGVFSTEKSHLAPGSFFTTEIHERFEQLEHEAYIDVRRPKPKVASPVPVGLAEAPVSPRRSES